PPTTLARRRKMGREDFGEEGSSFSVQEEQEQRTLDQELLVCSEYEADGACDEDEDQRDEEAYASARIEVPVKRMVKRQAGTSNLKGLMKEVQSEFILVEDSDDENPLPEPRKMGMGKLSGQTILSTAHPDGQEDEEGDAEDDQDIAPGLLNLINQAISSS